MAISLPKASRLSVPFVAALLLLAGCGDGPTAPDPLDAEALANRLELLSRRSPQLDAVMLGAAGVHFRDAGRVTPITVSVDGRSETWYAATSEMVFPPMPCLSPAPGVPCPDTAPLELRHIFAVDGVNATRMLVISASTAGSGSFDRAAVEWPALPATGVLLVRGKGVQAFATAGSVTTSVTENLGDCPERPQRGSRAQRIASCERVSIAWQVDAELTAVPPDGDPRVTMSLEIPAVEVFGVRLVLAPHTLPGG